MQKRVIRSNLSSAGSTTSSSGDKDPGGLTPLAPETDAPMIKVRATASSAQSVNTLCPPTPAIEPDPRVKDVVHDILRRQEDWETERAELDLYLQKVKDMVSTGNATLISNEIELDLNEKALMERSKNENDETRRKILDGFRKIKELDSVLKEKTLLAQSFSKPSTSAATLTNGTTSPTPLHPFPGTPATAPHPDFVDDDESECAAGASEASFELRSVRSLDTRTFLTEPRLLARRHGLAGVRGGSGGTGRGGTREAAEGIRPGMPTGAEGVAEKKGYKLGDFIQRNIVLGPQARYYHAMTEVEQERVDRILKEVDEEDEDEDDGMEEGESASSRRVADTPDEISSSATPRTFLSSSRLSKNTWLDPAELDRLAFIDKEIMSMHNGDDLDVASLVWTPSVWTPSASGYSTPLRPLSSVRDVKSVIDLHDLHEQDSKYLGFQSEAQRLGEIDERLRRFHEKRKGVDDDLEAPERIEELLDQIRQSMEVATAEL